MRGVQALRRETAARYETPAEDPLPLEQPARNAAATAVESAAENKRIREFSFCGQEIGSLSWDGPLLSNARGFV